MARDVEYLDCFTDWKNSHATVCLLTSFRCTPGELIMYDCAVVHELYLASYRVWEGVCRYKAGMSLVNGQD